MSLKRTWSGLTCLLAILITLVPGGRPALAADPPAGSTWYETFIDTPDRQRLHVDVMRPEGLTDEDKTPVILVVSPYLGMASQTEEPGPSNRFSDFFDGADVFGRRYSVVMVSLRGTGGSSGCLDILGPGGHLLRTSPDARPVVDWAREFLWSRAGTIYSGSSEVQRNIIAKRVLNLPQEGR